MRVWLLLAAAAVAFPIAHADVCATVGQNNPTACYNYYPQCYYDLNLANCVTGPPTLCQQYFTNSTLCHASTFGCLIAPSTGVCSLNTTNIAGSQPSYTTEATCLSAEYFWDASLTSCWTTLASVNNAFSCTYWSLPWDQNGSACALHGCAYIANSQCQDVGASSQSGNQLGSINYASSASFQDVAVIVPASGNTSTASFTYLVYAPITISDSLPTFSWVDMGVYPSQVSYTGLPMCTTNLNYGATPVPVNLATYNTNITAITSWIVNWITATGTMTWDHSLNGQAAAALLGNQTSNGFVKSISVSGTAYSGYFAIYNITFPLATYVSTCSATGLMVNITSQGSVYTLPASVVSQQPNIGSISAIDYLYATVSTAGIISVSASSPFFTSVTLAVANVGTHSCAAGLSSLFTSYYLVYSGVYDFTTQVGPRSLADIYVQLPGSQAVTNCYGDTPYSYNFVGCANAICTYGVTFYSACTALAADGSSFVTCPSNPALAGQHNFFVDVYSCPTGQPASASCVEINSSPYALSPITSSISIEAFPGVTVSQAFTVSLATLPTPTDTNLADLNFLGYQPNNTQLYSNQTLTFVATFTAAALQQALNLQIVPASITVEPLNVVGGPMPNQSIQTWTTLSPYMTYLPKQVQFTQADAVVLPLVAAEEAIGFAGFDGFAISAASLRQLAAANYYRVNTSYTILIPGSGFDGAPRRLLQVASTTWTEQAQFGSYGFTLNSQPNLELTHRHGVAIWTSILVIVALALLEAWAVKCVADKQLPKVFEAWVTKTE